MTGLINVKTKQNIYSKYGLVYTINSELYRYCDNIKVLKGNVIDINSAKKSFIKEANDVMGIIVKDFDTSFDLINIE